MRANLIAQLLQLALGVEQLEGVFPVDQFLQANRHLVELIVNLPEFVAFRAGQAHGQIALPHLLHGRVDLGNRLMHHLLQEAGQRQHDHDADGADHGNHPAVFLHPVGNQADRGQLTDLHRHRRGLLPVQKPLLSFRFAPHKTAAASVNRFGNLLPVHSGQSAVHRQRNLLAVLDGKDGHPGVFIVRQIAFQIGVQVHGRKRSDGHRVMGRGGLQRRFGQNQPYFSVFQRYAAGLPAQRIRNQLQRLLIQRRNGAHHHLAHGIQHADFQRIHKGHGVFNRADLIMHGGGLAEIVVIEDSAVIIQLQPGQTAVVQLGLHEQKQRIYVRGEGTHRRVDLLLAAFDNKVFEVPGGLLGQPENERADDPRYQQRNGQKNGQQGIEFFLSGHGCALLSEKGSTRLHQGQFRAVRVKIVS